jgi:hypothetical protein
VPPSCILKRVAPATSSTAIQPERRIRQTYLTRTAEYEVFDGVCVGVKDRRTGQTLPGHLALRARFQGGLDGRGCPVQRPGVGDALVLVDPSSTEGPRRLVTARIEAVARPPRELGGSTRAA